MSALFVAWRGGDPQNGVWGPVGRLEFDSGVYRFFYTRGARTLAGFRPFPQMDNLNAVYESEDLFPVFSNRLLSSSRPEFDAYLCWGGFDPDNPPEPISILSVTQGIRQTDSIEVFPCPAPDIDGCYINKFFLHGVRWVGQVALDRIARLKPNESLNLVPDPHNEFDPQAVAVWTADGMRLGYVPRYLAGDIGRLLSDCSYIELFAERVNQDAPLQQRVLCRLHACWPEGFLPCSDEAYSPIPHIVPVHCEA